MIQENMAMVKGIYGSIKGLDGVKSVKDFIQKGRGIRPDENLRNLPKLHGKVLIPTLIGG